MLTKKDYVAIAAIIKAEYERPDNLCYECGGIALAKTSEILAEYFATNNPRFSTARFLAACGTD